MKNNFSFNFMDIIIFYFKKILSNIFVLLLSFLIGLIYINNFYETKYVAKTTFMIGACFHDCEQEAHLNIDFNKKILFDYMQLLKSDRLLEKANKLANLIYSVSELRSMVTITYEEDTEYVIVSVEAKDKVDAAVLAYNLYDSLGSETQRIFDVYNIHLVDSNSIGYEKNSRNKLLMYNLIVAFIISIIKTIIEFIFFSKEPIKKPKISVKQKKKITKQEVK